MGWKEAPFWLKSGIVAGYSFSVVFVLILIIWFIFDIGPIKKGGQLEWLAMQPGWIQGIVSGSVTLIIFCVFFTVGVITSLFIKYRKH